MAIRTTSYNTGSKSYSKPSTPQKSNSASRSSSALKSSVSTSAKTVSSAPKRDTFTYSSTSVRQTSTTTKTSAAKTIVTTKSTQAKNAVSVIKPNTSAKASTMAKTASTSKLTAASVSSKNRDTFTYSSQPAKTAVKNNSANKSTISGALSKNTIKSAKKEVPEGLKLHLKHTTDPKQKAAMQKTIEKYDRKFPVSLDVGDISADYGHTDNGAHKKGHKGVDISAPAGTHIGSITGGEVVGVFNNETQGYRGYGNSVLVKGDDNMYYFYAHMDNVDVAVGDTVECGDILGGVGSTGNSTGNHLHFEIRTGGAWDSSKVNPHDYIIY